MHIKKPLLIAGVATTLGIAGISSLGIATAATNSSSSDSLVQKIATKFGLKESDVQAVFDQNKAAHDAERQQAMSDRLQAAVDAGKITAAQKTLIENKQKDLQTARQAEMKDLQAWADQQGIDVQYVMMHGRPGDDGSNQLQSLVDSGKITAAQKSAIEAKQQELQQKRESDRTSLEQWAKDNAIDTQYLMRFGGHPGGMGMGAPEGRF
ncbi:MAG TPA: hypothetical protein VLE73_02695 [Candidatus Saccharimonadales bacterium]|nr:hypothetical protein [Candidatus Saccharimonadales bacterium]